jgi:hypothetical protein
VYAPFYALLVGGWWYGRKKLETLAKFDSGEAETA